MKLPGWLENLFGFVKKVVKEYNDDRGAIVAAAISFYAFISLFPLILLGVAILGFVVGTQQSQAVIARNIRQTLPGPAADTVIGLVKGIVAGRTSASILGVLGLLWSGSALFVNLGVALNMAWDSERRRGFLQSRLFALGVLLVVGVLLMLSVGLSAGANALQNPHLAGSLTTLSPLWEFFGYLIPPFISVLMFTFIYKVLPLADVPKKAAIVGGVVAGITFEALKVGFTYYATNFSNFAAVYGSLGAIIALILWIFYSAIIAMFGAEVSQVYAKSVMHYGEIQYPQPGQRSA